MNTKLFFQICLFTLLVNTINADDQDDVILISSDAIEFKITKDQALLSKMLARSLTSSFMETGLKRIQLKIKKDDLIYIVLALDNATHIYKKPIISLSSEERKSLEGKVIARLSHEFETYNVDINTLLRLLKFADFLDFPELSVSIASLLSTKLSLQTYNPQEWRGLSTVVSKELGNYVQELNYSAFIPLFGNLPYKEFLGTKTNSFTPSRLSPDDRLVASVTDRKNVSIWDAKTGALKSTLPLTRTVGSFTISSDNKLIGIHDMEQTSIWDIETGEQLHVLSRQAGRSLSQYSGVRKIRFSPDKKYIITPASDGVPIWNVDSGNFERLLVGHTAAINDAQFSPDSKLIVTASSDKTARIWDVETGETRHELGGWNSIEFAQFSPNNKLVVTIFADKTVTIWDVASGASTYRFRGHTKKIKGATFSSDSELIVTFSESGSVLIWNLETDKTGGRPGTLTKLEGHTDWVKSAEFSPDNRFLITASRDNTARMWDVKTGALVHVLKANFEEAPRGYGSSTYGFTFAQFSRDGTRILTSLMEEEATRLWDLSPIKEFIYGGLTVEQALFVKMLNNLPLGQTLASMAQRTNHLSEAHLINIFKTFTPFIQRSLSYKYSLRIFTFAQRRKRMQRRLALRRRRLQARG